MLAEIVVVFERYLVSLEIAYHNRFLDRAFDPERLKVWERATHSDIWPAVGSTWHIASLAVSPQHQRKGIGARFVKCGQELAAGEGIPLSLESSVPGLPLYRKMGCKIVDEAVVAGDVDCVTLLWEPEGCEGKWLEDVGDGRAEIKGRVRDTPKS